MNRKLILVFLSLAFTLTACNVNPSHPLSARPSSDEKEGKDDSDNKVEPVPGKAIEKTKALIFQKPTFDESAFLNVMNIEVTDTHEQAFFSFLHSPDEDGVFYFSVAHSVLQLNECSKPTERKYNVRIIWQEIKNGRRVIVKTFHPDIDEFQFKKDRKYVFSYVLMNLKEFADCKSVTLKMAPFLKRYSQTKEPKKEN